MMITMEGVKFKENKNMTSRKNNFKELKFPDPKVKTNKKKLIQTTKIMYQISRSHHYLL